MGVLVRIWQLLPPSKLKPTGLFSYIYFQLLYQNLHQITSRIRKSFWGEFFLLLFSSRSSSNFPVDLRVCGWFSLGGLQILCVFVCLFSFLKFSLIVNLFYTVLQNVWPLRERYMETPTWLWKYITNPWKKTQYLILQAR